MQSRFYLPNTRPGYRDYRLTEMAAIDAIPELTASERERVCELTARDMLGED